MKKTINLAFLGIMTILLLTGCADNGIVDGCVQGHVYGFWGGYFHGLIIPFDFIGMLIWDDVIIYAPNNNGTWYAFGFILGGGGLAPIIKLIAHILN